MVTKWEVEFTDEFGDWWFGLDEAEQESVDASVRLLESAGPWLSFQLKGKWFRCAILLIGGDKTGDGRWYMHYIPVADRLYDEHLETLKQEGPGNS